MMRGRGRIDVAVDRLAEIMTLAVVDNGAHPVFWCTVSCGVIKRVPVVASVFLSTGQAYIHTCAVM